MSPSVKLGLLTLISAAAAVPHYAHDRLHHRALGGYSMPGHSGTGAPYPTGHGGPGGHNHNHTHPHSPHGSGSVPVPVHEPTTTILQTDTSTLIIYSTIYASPSPVSAGAEGVHSVDVSSAGAHCGPETVYVTATNKVTVTVAPGSSSSSSSSSSAAAVVAPSSVKPAASSSAAYVPKPQPKPSSSAEAVASSAPVYKAPSAVTSALAIPTDVEKPSLSISLINKAPSSPAPQPAATSAAASSPHYSGAKRGLAYNDASLCSQFNTGSYGFSYNWGQTGTACAGGAFVPMMHKPSDSTAEAWLANVDKAVAAGAKMVMGFNECDIATQANMSPQQACADWKNYMNPIRAQHPSLTIHGPSVSNSGLPGQGLTWLDEFHASCPDAAWDAANIHFYDIPTDGVVGRFQSHFESAKKYGKQVFVTEFGLNAGSAAPAQAQSFLQGVMDFMDGEATCGGYAYFMVGTDSSMNMLNVGGGLSAVGKVYNS